VRIRAEAYALTVQKRKLKPDTMSFTGYFYLIGSTPTPFKATEMNFLFRSIRIFTYKISAFLSINDFDEFLD